MLSWLEDVEGSIGLGRIASITSTTMVRLASHGSWTLYLRKEARRVELTINTNKTKIFDLTGHCTLPTCIKGQNIEKVDQFLIFVYANGSTETDVILRNKST